MTGKEIIKALEDNKIVEALECCLSDNPPCYRCKYDADTFTVDKCMGKLMKDALDLINRQQHQLENYSHKVRTMAKDICRYKAKIDRLKDKNLELLNKFLPYEEYPPLENIIEEKESDTE